MLKHPSLSRVSSTVFYSTLPWFGVLGTLRRLRIQRPPSSAFPTPTLCSSRPFFRFVERAAKTVVVANYMAQDKGLTDLFTEIVTNPAEWDDSGLLKLRRRVDPAGVQHKCTVGCSPNMCKGATPPAVHSLCLMLLQATNWRPSWNATNPTLTESSMSGMGATTTAPSFALEGTSSGSKSISPTHERFPAKILFSAGASKGWKVESKKKAPRMDSSVRFASGPKLGRSRNTSTPCTLESTRHNR